MLSGTLRSRRPLYHAGQPRSTVNVGHSSSLRREHLMYSGFRASPVLVLSDMALRSTQLALV